MNARILYTLIAALTCYATTTMGMISRPVRQLGQTTGRTVSTLGTTVRRPLPTLPGRAPSRAMSTEYSAQQAASTQAPQLEETPTTQAATRAARWSLFRSPWSSPATPATAEPVAPEQSMTRAEAAKILGIDPELVKLTTPIEQATKAYLALLNLYYPNIDPNLNPDPADQRHTKLNQAYRTLVGIDVPKNYTLSGIGLDKTTREESEQKAKSEGERTSRFDYTRYAGTGARVKSHLKTATAAAGVGLGTGLYLASQMSEDDESSAKLRWATQDAMDRIQNDISDLKIIYNALLAKKANAEVLKKYAVLITQAEGAANALNQQLVDNRNNAPFMQEAYEQRLPDLAEIVADYKGTLSHYFVNRQELDVLINKYMKRYNTAVESYRTTFNKQVDEQLPVFKHGYVNPDELEKRSNELEEQVKKRRQEINNQAFDANKKRYGGFWARWYYWTGMQPK